MPHPNEIVLCVNSGVTPEFVVLDNAIPSPATGEDARKREALYLQFNRQLHQQGGEEPFYFAPDE